MLRIAALLLLAPLLCARAQAATDAELDAARLLAQASFGPTVADIEAVAGLGAEAWVEQQLRLAPTLHMPLYREHDPLEGYGALQGVWLQVAVNAPDQLRQRVAFALSEILVVSARSDIPTEGLVNYYDILVRGAFGNYRALLGNVARSMAMGRYLSMYQNRNPDAAQGIRADENFARELMQLFTIGLVKLNPDGTPQLNAKGRTIPTYSQVTVENLARIMTGWSSGNTPSFYYWPPDWTAPMRAFEDYHDRDEKRFLGKIFAAGRGAEQELARALDVLFAHPNVGPFVARQLIQRLVTSNPTPEYVERVAAVFGDNGAGVRGDLRSVVRAILLDPEARRGHLDLPERFGKVREPLLRLTHLLRAFEAVSTAPDGTYPSTWVEWGTSQAPLGAPSVFNFFSPGYSPDGELRELGLVAPEMKLADDSRINRAANYTGSLLWAFGENPGITIDEGSPSVLISLGREAALAHDPDALLDHLDLLLTSGTMGEELRVAVRRRIPDWRYEWDENAGFWRARGAIYLVMNSPQYLVQK